MQSDPPEGPPRLVCRCLGVSSTRIAAMAREGCISLQEIEAELRAGTGCTTCEPEIDEILASVCGEPVADAVRARNRALCQSETRQRIEAALFGQIAPRLPAGTQLELIAVEGLLVDLHLTPGDPDSRELIAEKLRKFVCPDIEVIYS